MATEEREPTLADLFGTTTYKTVVDVTDTDVGFSIQEQLGVNWYWLKSSKWNGPHETEDDAFKALDHLNSLHRMNRDGDRAFYRVVRRTATESVKVEEVIRV